MFRFRKQKSLSLCLHRPVSYTHLTRTKGRGSFVSRKKITQEYTRFISSYRDELQKKGLTPRTVVTSFEKKKATVSISEKLDLAEDSSVYQLSRLRYIDSDPHKKPVLFTTVYLPCTLCPVLDSTQFEDASLYDTLESQGLFVSHVPVSYTHLDVYKRQGEACDKRFYCEARRIR